jgi:hypothetical protein
MRVCGDYRMANEQLQKSSPTNANGTDELSKLPVIPITGTQTDLVCTTHTL